MKKPDNETETIVSSMLQIYDYLKSQGRLDYQGNGTRFLYSTNCPVDESEEQVRHLMDNVLKRITEKNPQVSNHTVYENLLFNLTQMALWYPSEFHAGESEYREATEKLLSYSATREIDSPIVNLRVGDRPIKFGLIWFFPMDEETDKTRVWWKNIRDTAGHDEHNIYSFARIKCPGDKFVSLDYASKNIGEMLNFLRGIGFPTHDNQNMHFGQIQEYPLFQTRPYRRGKPKENSKINLDSNEDVVQRLSPGIVVCDLQNDILGTIESSDLNRLQVLIENDFGKTRTRIKEKFFLGLRWLGDATKPDTPESKVIKLSVALESFIGGDAGEKKGNLSSRGLTATLAERAAFLIEEDASKRRQIHDQIYEFYGYRSGIVHTGHKKISNEQISDFTLLLRKVCFAVLRNIEKFKDIEQLQEWVFEKRYEGKESD